VPQVLAQNEYLVTA